MVALKRLHPHLGSDATALEMLEAEARIGRRLRHPNIAAVIDSGPGYLVMEHVEGRSLLELLRVIGRAPPPGLGAFIVAKICRGLAYAHHLSDDDGTPLHLVHRDVKPANVMLGRDGSIKLLDFGIAKELGNQAAPRTATGVRKGTQGYFAPEQLEGRAFDARADLFAAGVVLHELLTGRPLFGDDAPRVAPPPSRQNPAVPPDLDALCLRALSLDPVERPANADQMAEALEAIAARLGFDESALVRTLQKLQPEAREPTAPTVAKRRSASSRRLIAGGLALLAAGLVVLVLRLLWPRPSPIARSTAKPSSPAVPAIDAGIRLATGSPEAPRLAPLASPITPAPTAPAPPARGTRRKHHAPTHRPADDPLHPSDVSDPFR
jgi:serine/threonine-protein kinase